VLNRNIFGYLSFLPNLYFVIMMTKEVSKQG